MADETNNPTETPQPETLEEQLDLLLAKIEEREPGTLPKQIRKQLAGEPEEQSEEQPDGVDQAETASEHESENASIDDLLSADIPELDAGPAEQKAPPADADPQIAEAPDAILNDDHTDSVEPVLSDQITTVEDQPFDATDPDAIADEDPNSAESGPDDAFESVKEPAIAQDSIPEEPDRSQLIEPLEAVETEGDQEPVESEIAEEGIETEAEPVTEDETDSIESQIDQLISAVHATQKEESISGDIAGFSSGTEGKGTGGETGPLLDTSTGFEAEDDEEIDESEIDNLLEKAQAAQQGFVPDDQSDQQSVETDLAESESEPATGTKDAEAGVVAGVPAGDDDNEVQVMQIEQLDEMLAKEAEKEVSEEIEGDVETGVVTGGGESGETESPDLPAEAPGTAHFKDTDDDDDVDIEELSVDDDEEEEAEAEQASTSGFAAASGDVAGELDTQPEDRPARPRHDTEEHDIESETATRGGLNIFAALAMLWIFESALRQTCAIINKPLTGTSPDIRRTIGYIGLLTLCNAVFLLIFLFLF